MKTLILILIFLFISCSNSDNEKLSFLEKAENYENLRHNYFTFAENSDFNYYIKQLEDLKIKINDLKPKDDWENGKTIKNKILDLTEQSIYNLITMSNKMNDLNDKRTFIIFGKNHWEIKAMIITETKSILIEKK